jgi:hypothetical protein
MPMFTNLEKKSEEPVKETVDPAPVEEERPSLGLENPFAKSEPEPEAPHVVDPSGGEGEKIEETESTLMEEVKEEKPVPVQVETPVVEQTPVEQPQITVAKPEEVTVKPTQVTEEVIEEVSQPPEEKEDKITIVDDEGNPIGNDEPEIDPADALLPSGDFGADEETDTEQVVTDPSINKEIVEQKDDTENVHIANKVSDHHITKKLQNFFTNKWVLITLVVIIIGVVVATVAGYLYYSREPDMFGVNTELTIENITGNVQYISGDIEDTLFLSDTIPTGYQVLTDEGQTIELTINNETTILIPELSLVTFNEIKTKFISIEVFDGLAIVTDTSDERRVEVRMPFNTYIVDESTGIFRNIDSQEIIGATRGNIDVLDRQYTVLEGTTFAEDFEQIITVRSDFRLLDIYLELVDTL